MDIFDIVKSLEISTGVTVEAHVTNNELILTFDGRIKKALTDEEVRNFTPRKWLLLTNDITWSKKP